MAENFLPQPSPNTINETSTRRRRRAAAHVAAPVLALVAACGHNPVISTEITSDDLAATLDKGCPVDDRFSLSQVTLAEAGKMQAPAPVGERQIQLYAANLYNATTPDAERSIHAIGGVDARTGEEIDASLRYYLDGKIVEETTEAGHTICVLEANFQEHK